MKLIEVVETLFGGTGSPRAAEAAGYLADDLVMIEGGANLRSGTHRGKAAMGALMKKIQDSCDHFQSDLVWIKGDDQMVISLAHAHGRRNGRDLDTHVLTTITADDDGQIVEIRDLPFDWDAWEEFFAVEA
ncbi:nuclear transport factor 2 family protein [Microbacterium sp. A588]